MNPKRLIVDGLLLVGVITSMAANLAGEELPGWIYPLLTGLLMIHILAHWQWLTTVGLVFFESIVHPSRFLFVLDTGLFVLLVTLITSGMIISWNISLVHEQTWMTIYQFIQRPGVIFVGLHLVFHGEWIYSTVRQRQRQSQISNHASPTVSQNPREKHVSMDAVDQF